MLPLHWRGAPRLNDLAMDKAEQLKHRHQGGVVRALAARGMDLLFPPQCLRCRALVEDPGSLCGDCWREVTFVTEPFCACCGLPFAHDVGDGALCGACAADPPGYTGARAVMVYNDASRDLILGFKYADATHAAPSYGKWLVRAGRACLAGADLLVPVPLHWMRLFRRRYNQAALLAHAVSKQTGVPVSPRALVRQRRTPPLGRLNREARRQTLSRAIVVNPKEAGTLTDRQVVLVDDVMTTGETAEACTKQLLRAGARSVDILSLARAVRTEV